MPGFSDMLTDGFMPHGFCLRWNGPLLLVFIAGNLGIAIAYFIIPIALRPFAGKRKDLPYPYMFRLFAAFIASCGVTHLAKVWTIYQPAYWLEALMDLWTAAISLLTAALLIPLIPQALALRSPRELEQEVDRRTKELKESEERFKTVANAIPQLCWVADNDIHISRRKRRPIIALTAHSDRDKCHLAGMDDYLLKPAFLLDWQRMLEKWLPRDS